MQEFQLQLDGHTLHGTLWGTPIDGAEVIQICHGLGEHHRRYQRLATELVAAGYVVVAHDHRGHGQALAKEALGHFADSDGWNKVVDDVAKVKRHVRSQLQPERWWLLGHSMGSYIAQARLQRSPEFADGLVLSGSTHAPRFDVRIGRWIARFERWRLGARARSTLLAKMSFGSFNKRFEPARTAFDWLSRDPAEVDRYVDDPCCGADSTTSLWIDLLGGLLEIGAPANMRRLAEDLPVYILAGEDDPVSGDKGIEALTEQYLRAGVRQLSVDVYPDARHELFNETHRGAVTNKLIEVIRSWNQTAA